MGVVRPAVLETLRLSELRQLDQALVRRIGKDGDAEAEQFGTPRSCAGKEPFSRESRRVAMWPYYLFAVAAGAMLPIQFGINAQLASWVGSPLRATLISFAVGTAVLGVATLFAFILAGQAVASLAVDHFGWVGFDENPITPGRLLGMALVAAGVAAVRFL